METPPEKRYWAFISYSHVDRAWGDWLHRALENFPIAKDLRGRTTPCGDPIPPRLFPVFRDREELPTSNDLGAVIDQALRVSRFLVVICSPRSAASQWVNQEILRFKSLHGDDRVLCLIVDGEPWASDGKPGCRPEDECFPEAVRYKIGADGKASPERAEPIAADAREGKDGKANAIIKLAAGLLGVGFNDLRRRELEYQRRRIRRLQVLTAGFAMLFLAAMMAGWYALRQKREVERTLSKADLQLAVQAREKNDIPQAAAYLARALEHDPANTTAAAAAWSLLAHQPWHTPAGPALVHREPITTAFATTDGEAILTAAGPRLLRWNRKTQALEASHTLDAGRITAASEFPLGGYAAIGTSDGRVLMVDLENLTPDANPIFVSAESRPIRGLAWRPDAMAIAVGLDGSVCLVAPASERAPQTPTPRSDNTRLAWSPDGRRLAAAGGSNAWHLIEQGGDAWLEARAFQTTLIVVDLAFSSPTNLSVMDPVKGWLDVDLTSGKEQKIAPGSFLGSFAPGGAAFLALANERSFQVRRKDGTAIAAHHGTLSLRNGVFLDPATVVAWGAGNVASVVHLAAPTDTAITHFAKAEIPPDLACQSSDGLFAATASSAVGLVQVWDARKGTPAARPLRLPAPAVAMAFGEKSDRLHVLTTTGHVHEIDWRAPLRSPAPPRALATALDPDPLTAQRRCGFSPRGNRLAIVGDTAVAIHQAAGETSIPHGYDSPPSFTWHPDGRRLLIWRASPILALHDVEAPENTTPISLDEAVMTAAFDPGGTRIAVAFTSSAIQIIDVETGTPLGPKIQPPDAVAEVAWTGDSRHLCLAGLLGTLDILDAATGTVVASLRFPDQSVQTLAPATGTADAWILGNHLQRIPMPPKAAPPDWLPAMLEALGGTTLRTGRRAPPPQPDSWLHLRARLATDRGPWAALARSVTTAPAARAVATRAQLAAESRIADDLQFLHDLQNELSAGTDPDPAALRARIDAALTAHPENPHLRRALAAVALPNPADTATAAAALRAFADSPRIPLADAVDAWLDAAELLLETDPPAPAEAHRLATLAHEADPANPRAKALMQSTRPGEEN